LTQVMRALGHPMAFTLALLMAISLALLAFTAAKNRRDNSAPTGTKRFAVAAIVLSLLFILYVTLMPRGLGRPSTLSLIPFADTVHSLLQPNTFQVTIVGVIGNILLFVPLGFAVAFAHGRPEAGRVPVLSAVVISILIESAQFAMNQGAAATVDDVCANVAGAALGWLAARRLSRTRVS